MEVSKESIKKFDQDNMFGILEEFHTQISTGINAGQSIEKREYKFDKIVFCGIGGSAISGDILRSYLEQIGFAKLIYINREYQIPKWVDENTLVIASSYSGNTEETISAYEEATKLTDSIICFTTGGKLQELAKSNNHLIVQLEAGMMPRCALAMSFFAILSAFLYLGIVPRNLSEDIEKAINDTYQSIQKLSKRYKDYTNNEAVKLAELLNGKKIVLYSGKVFSPVALRWAGQLHENSKAHSFFNVLPEMNHNEINSWDYKENNTDYRIILIKDNAEHKRVQKRLTVLSEILKDKVTIYGFSSDANYLLTRMFEMIYFGDWVSYYLAIKRGIDPTPIPTITKLKELMSSN